MLHPPGKCICKGFPQVRGQGGDGASLTMYYYLLLTCTHQASEAREEAAYHAAEAARWQGEAEARRAEAREVRDEAAM